MMRPIVLLASQLYTYVRFACIQIFNFFTTASARYNEKIERKKKKNYKFCKPASITYKKHVENTLQLSGYIFVLLGDWTWKFYTIICDWYERGIYIAFIQDKHTLSALYEAHIFQQGIYRSPCYGVVSGWDLLKLK